MCFILATGKFTLDYIDILENAWMSNNDGAGISTHDGDKLVMMKPYTRFSHLRDSLRNLAGQPAVVHLRMATHGGVSGANTHPFWTCGKKALLSHNGIMPMPWCGNRALSDSRQFAESLMNLDAGDIYDGRDNIGKAIGHNKVVIMKEDGSIFVINKDFGYDLDKETWCSANPSYMMGACYTKPANYISAGGYDDNKYNHLAKKQIQ